MPNAHNTQRNTKTHRATKETSTDDRHKTTTDTKLQSFNAYKDTSCDYKDKITQTDYTDTKRLNVITKRIKMTTLKFTTKTN